jgi:hypothetical protein
MTAAVGITIVTWWVEVGCWPSLAASLLAAHFRATIAPLTAVHLYSPSRVRVWSGPGRDGITYLIDAKRNIAFVPR